MLWRGGKHKFSNRWRKSTHQNGGDLSRGWRNQFGMKGWGEICWHWSKQKRSAWIWIDAMNCIIISLSYLLTHKIYVLPCLPWVYCGCDEFGDWIEWNIFACYYLIIIVLNWLEICRQIFISTTYELPISKTVVNHYFFDIIWFDVIKSNIKLRFLCYLRISLLPYSFPVFSVFFRVHFLLGLEFRCHIPEKSTTSDLRPSPHKG